MENIAFIGFLWVHRPIFIIMNIVSAQKINVFFYLRAICNSQNEFIVESNTMQTTFKDIRRKFSKKIEIPFTHSGIDFTRERNPTSIMGQLGVIHVYSYTDRSFRSFSVFFEGSRGPVAFPGLRFPLQAHFPQPSERVSS